MFQSPTVLIMYCLLIKSVKDQNNKFSADTNPVLLLLLPLIVVAVPVIKDVVRHSLALHQERLASRILVLLGQILHLLLHTGQFLLHNRVE